MKQGLALIAFFLTCLGFPATTPAQVNLHNSQPPPSVSKGRPVFRPQQPAQPPIVQPNLRPVVLPVPHDELDDFLEDIIEQRFRRCIDSVDVDVNRGCIEINVDAREFASFCVVRDYVQRLPYLTGYRMNIYLDDLEDILEQRIERAFGRFVDDVDVDIDHERRRMEIQVEIRHPRVAVDLQRFVASLPEAQGYGLRYEIDFD